MDRSRLLQVVVNYQQPRRALDCYIETGTDHEAKGLESVTTTTTTMTMTIIMMMMMMMIKIVVMVGLMVVIVTKTVTVGQEMPP
jgi:hypothetical protein